MVTFHVSFQIGVLSESLSTLGARESVFVLVREMNHLAEQQRLISISADSQYLVFLQSVFPPESFSTEATLVRGLASVGHHMLPGFKQVIRRRNT